MVGFDILSEAIFYLLRTFLTVAMVTLCYHGNHTKGNLSAKFDAHTHDHCQEIHNNKYYMGLLLVAMATIEVDSVRAPRPMVIGVVLLYITVI